MHSVCTSHHAITMRAIWSVFLRCFTHCRRTAHTAVLGARHLSTREWFGQPPAVFVSVCNVLHSSACDMRFLLRTATCD